MNPIRTSSLIALALGISLGLGSAAAESVTFKQGATVVSSDGLIHITDYNGTEDTSMVQESPNNNYGGRTTILVGVLGSGRVRTGIIRYDLSALAGKYQTIDSMTLRLYVDAMKGSQTMGVSLEREGNAGWVEGSVNGTPQSGSADWKYAQADTVDWLGGQNGARGTADLYGTVASVPLDGTVAGPGTWVEISIDPSGLPPEVNTLTKIVGLWNGGGNAGIHMSYGSPSGGPQWQFASSETGTAEHAPELVIEYTPVSSGTVVRPGQITLPTLTLADGETSILRPGTDLVTVSDADGFSVGAAPGDTHTITLERTADLAAGTYTLIDYTGAIGGAGFAGLVLDVPPHLHATLVDNAAEGKVDVQITAIDALVWDGDAGTNDWDESTPNFKIPGGSQNEAYSPGDDVVFDDSATNAGTVNVAVEVAPSSLAFDNDTLSYTLTGEPIAGATGLDKQGGGTLTLLNDNTFSGGTHVGAGRLVLGDGITGSLASAVNVSAGATLEINAPAGDDGLPISGDGSIVFTGANEVTRTAAIDGAAAVSYTGTGTLVLNSANSFTGGLHVVSGTVAAVGQNAKNRLASDSTITVESGATFDVRNTNALPTFEAPRIPVSFVLNGGTLTASGDHNHTNLLDVTLNDGAEMTTEPGVGVYNGENFRINGNLTVGGATPSSITMEYGLGLGAVSGYESHVFDVADVTGDENADLTIDCDLIVFAGAELLKQGAGTIQFNGSGEYFAGVLTIDAGAMVLGEFADLDGASRIEVRAGANLDVTALGDLFVVNEAQTLAGNGTITGNVDLWGILAPGASVGTLTISDTLTVNSDCELAVEIGDWATGQADLIAVGTFEVFSDSDAPAVITIDGASMTNFSESAKTITIVQTTSDVTGFEADAFVIQTTNFPGLGTWTVQQNGNNIELVYAAGTDPYLAWAASMGLDATNNGFETDAEGDGVDNGLEWILDGDPLAQDAATILPTPAGDAATGLTLTFTRNEGTIGQTTLVVDWDTDLDGGFAHSIEVEATSSSDPATGTTVTIDDTPTPDSVTVLIPATNAPDGKLFARLRATRP